MNSEIEQEPMTTEELENAHVLTAIEIWFIHYSSGWKIRDLEGNFMAKLLSSQFSSRVKFVLVYDLISDDSRCVNLGIFYPEQSAAVNAHALRDYLNWELDSVSLSRDSDLLSYWPKKYTKPIQQSPIKGRAVIIGGWEIHWDKNNDESSSMTIRDNFWVEPISSAHMVVVRRLVLDKLGLNS